MEPLSQLSRTGEIAQFIDDDQFGFGQSVDKCGYEAVALFWHSVPVGKTNPYHASDIHAMASADYVRFTHGPDAPANQNGMSLAQLYADLQFHRFLYRPVSFSFEYIFGWLKYGYPVILAVTEDSVYDVSLRAKPYAWNTAGLSHIILATGRGKTGVLVRDTANVQSPGVARPGPREYDNNRLHIISATMVVPSWLENPPANFDPYQASAVTPIDFHFEATPAERALFEKGAKEAIFNPMWAIVKSWIEAYRAGHWYGIPLESEQEIVVNGIKYREQAYSAALARWNETTGVVTWAKP